jgi:N-acyl-D-amino-acid deacylase
MHDLAVTTGVPFVVGAMSPASLPQIDHIAAAGGRIFGVTHPRGIGTMSSFRSQLPFDQLAEWQQLRVLPESDQKRALRDPEVRRRLVRAAGNATYVERLGGEARPPDYDLMRVLDRPVPPNPTVREAALARGVDPVELIIDLSLEHDFGIFFWQPNAPFDHAAVKAVLAHPRTVVGFSDAGAHVSQMSDCSIHTHVLAHWVRDRQDFTLEDAVRKMTLAPARAWGLHDRGLVREGMVADLNVFDPETVSPDLPRLVHDLPAGAPRIEQTATGIRATIVGGRVTLRDGVHTGATPGVLIRARRAGRSPSAPR